MNEISGAIEVVAGEFCANDISRADAEDEEGAVLDPELAGCKRLGPEGFRFHSLIVCGIETHVCVSQTAHDLLGKGVEVHNPADAVGSRHAIDYERGLERLERAGAVVGTVEAALFELLERAGTPEFKSVQKLIL